MAIFLLLLYIMVFQEFCSIEGVAICTHFMNIPEPERDAVPGIISPRFLRVQYLPVHPVGINHVFPIPCNVDQMQILQPRLFELPKCRKWKTVHIVRPRPPPANVKAMSDCRPTPPSFPVKEALKDSQSTARFGTRYETVSSLARLKDHFCISNVSPRPVIFCKQPVQQKIQLSPETTECATKSNGAEGDQKLKNQQNGKIASIIKVECIPPSLAALDCLTVVRACRQNATSDDKISTDKPDKLLTPVVSMSSYTNVTKNSSELQTNSVPKVEENAISENPLEDDDEFDPYFKKEFLQHLDPTEKQSNSTEGFGQDVPLEGNQNDKNRTKEESADEKWLNQLVKIITSSERPTRNPELSSHLSDVNTDCSSTTSAYEGEDSVSDWSGEEEVIDHTMRNSGQLTKVSSPGFDQGPIGTLNCRPFCAPQMSRYFSNPTIIRLF